ncbi:MAG: cysteine synthase family protein [Candidatus Woesearchaeota archaeon]
MINKSIIQTIGNTPLLKIGKIFAKLETANPSGSVKDRMAKYMIAQAELRKELTPGQQIIELTTGNTGIAFALVAAIKGYNFTALMPKSMSSERKQMMEAFGAEVVFTPDNMTEALTFYNNYVKQHPNAWLPKQFENPDNLEAHRLGLGMEIIKQIPEVDAFVAGVGTGGTLLGVAKALKAHNPKIKIIAVEPAESAVLSGKQPGEHGIQGIGEGFIPKIVQDNLSLIDQVVQVSTTDSIAMSKQLAKQGILAGISSGTNMAAALTVQDKYKNIVTVLPDRGERYLSNNLYR